MGKRRVIVPGIGVLVVVFALALLVWGTVDRQPSQIITLSDGRQYRFAGVTWGTNHYQPGHLLYRVMNHFPTNWVGPLRAKLGARYRLVPPIDTYTPSLLVWLEPLGTNSPVANAKGTLGSGFSGKLGGVALKVLNFDLAGYLADESGVRSGYGGIEEIFGTNWPVVQFTEVPRRSRTLECDLWQVDSREPFKIKFRNPAFGRFPQWQPETLPRVKSAGDIRISLEAITNEPLVPLTDFSASAWRTRLSFTLDTAGSSGLWGGESLELSDATGNHLGAGWAQDGVHRLNGALWPGESAWRVKVGLWRTAVYPAADLVTFSNIPISQIGAGSMYSVTNYHNGIPVSLRMAAEVGSTSSYPSGIVQWQTDWGVFPSLPGQNEEYVTDVVELRTDTGDGAYKINGLFRFEHAPHDSRINAPPNAKTFTVTVAVSKIQYVEFLVKPPSLGTNR